MNSKKFRRKYENFVMYNYKDDEKEAKRLLKVIDWDAWLNKPGPAPVQMDFMT